METRSEPDKDISVEHPKANTTLFASDVCLRPCVARHNQEQIRRGPTNILLIAGLKVR
jgi:hypothetical protein